MFTSGISISIHSPCIIQGYSILPGSVYIVTVGGHRPVWLNAWVQPSPRYGWVIVIYEGVGPGIVRHGDCADGCSLGLRCLCTINTYYTQYSYHKRNKRVWTVADSSILDRFCNCFLGSALPQYEVFPISPPAFLVQLAKIFSPNLISVTARLAWLQLP